MIDINLLPPQNVLSQKEKILRSQLTVAAIIGGVVTALVLGSLALINAYYSARLSAVAARRTSLTAQFNAVQKTALDLRLIKDKIAGINSIKTSQTQFPPILDDLTALFSGGFQLTQLSVDQTQKTSFAGITAGPESFNTLLGRIIAGRDANKYGQIELSGLRENKDKTLSFSIQMLYENK
ncbi:hypothetical protein M1403_00415 [Patescibacteria group bacterium]|nr:hypothetical protein [Patescibacteria group bacterium]